MKFLHEIRTRLYFPAEVPPMNVLAVLFAPLVAKVVGAIESVAWKVVAWAVMALVLGGCLVGLWYDTGVAVKLLLTLETIDMVAIYLSVAGVIRYPALDLPAWTPPWAPKLVEPTPDPSSVPTPKPPTA